MLTNLEPDHLDRHVTFDAYAAAKLRVFALQSEDDVAVVPAGFRTVPGAARRVEFSGADLLPAEPLIPGIAQQGERCGRDGRRPCRRDP